MLTVTESLLGTFIPRPRATDVPGLTCTVRAGAAVDVVVLLLEPVETGVVGSNDVAEPDEVPLPAPLEEVLLELPVVVPAPLLEPVETGVVGSDDVAEPDEVPLPVPLGEVLPELPIAEPVPPEEVLPELPVVVPVPTVVPPPEVLLPEAELPLPVEPAVVPVVLGAVELFVTVSLLDWYMKIPLVSAPLLLFVLFP